MNDGRRVRWSLAVAASLIAARVHATDPQPKAYTIPYTKYSLDNGLEVLLHRDPSLPRVAVNLWYHVGPATEPKGRSGFAHLFEHLMFEGSKHAGTEFDRLLEAAGATNVNGTTSWDRTNYFEEVPSEHLEMVLWLESDRMGFMLDALSQERLDVQRDVVKNERRQRHENAPYGPSDLAMYDVLFPDGHPYHGAIIGSMADLSRGTLEDVRAFFRRFYAPSNATIAIAGDFDVTTTRDWIARYFGTLPRAPKPPRVRYATPALERATRIEIEEPVQLGRVQMAWITPPAYSDGDIVLDVVARLLADGKATRLYRALVVDQQLCPNVNTWLDSNALASVLAIEATVSQKSEPAEISRAIDTVLQALQAEGPTDDELARAKKKIEVEVRTTLQQLNDSGGEGGRAGILQRFNHYLANPGGLPEYMKRIRAVSGDQVRQAIATHLNRQNRAVIVTVPKTTPTRGAQ